MKVTPPFKINESQLRGLEESASKIGIDKSKIARAAIQRFNDQIKNAGPDEVARIIVSIVNNEITEY